MSEQDFKSAVIAASARSDVVAAVRGLYDDLQRQIDMRRPICVMSGRCCHFEQWGHRLYVTTLELAAFVAGPADLPGTRVTEWDGKGCPFQVDGLCGVHPIRPFGCRVYFCDATAAGWQQERYAVFHARLREMHDSLGVPYHYVEWRQALAAVPGIRAERSGG